MGSPGRGKGGAHALDHQLLPAHCGRPKGWFRHVVLECGPRVRSDQDKALGDSWASTVPLCRGRASVSLGAWAEMSPAQLCCRGLGGSPTSSVC